MVGVPTCATCAPPCLNCDNATHCITCLNSSLTPPLCRNYFSFVSSQLAAQQPDSFAVELLFDAPLAAAQSITVGTDLVTTFGALTLGADYAASAVTDALNASRVVVTVQYLRTVSAQTFALSIPPSNGILDARGWFLNASGATVFTRAFGIVFLETNLTQTEKALLGFLSGSANTLQNENATLVQFAKYLQLTKLFANVQVFIAPLLVAHRIPQLLYETERALAASVLYYVPAQEETQDNTGPFVLLNVRLDETYYANERPDQPLFRKFRFTANFLVNTLQTLLFQCLVALAFVGARCASCRTCSSCSSSACTRPCATTSSRSRRSP